MPLFDSDNRDYSRTLKNMIVELGQIQQECNPEGGQSFVDQKNMDKFQKKQVELVNKMEELQNGLTQLAEKEKSSSGRDQTVIALSHKNRKLINEVQNLFKELKDIHASDKKKRKKKDQSLMEERDRYIRTAEKSIQKLQNAVNPGMDEKSDRYRSRTEQRRKEREDKNRKRKDRRKKGKDNADTELKIHEVGAREQAFLDEVNENREKEDAMLDEISKGLDELKNIGTDINKSLAYQNELLNQVDTKLTDVTEQFDSGNKRLQDLLDSQGGPSRWIPRLCCIVLLLAVVGYVLKLFFGI